MLELLRKLFQARNTLSELDPLLRELVHSEMLTEYVRSTASPVDDLVLRLLRVLIAREK